MEVDRATYEEAEITEVAGMADDDDGNNDDDDDDGNDEYW